MKKTGTNMLSNQQKEAVECKYKNILVSAGPGSGKTVVIVNRVYYLIRTLKISPRNIIVITFTKAAAENMRKRFMAMDRELVSPFFGTFHGLCYRILKNYYGDISIIESWEIYKIVKGFLASYMEEVSDDRIKDYINGISLMKVKGEVHDSSNIDSEILKGCLAYYEHYKQEKNLLDFDDLQLMTRDLLKKNGKVLEGYRRTFNYILVDEFQDTDDVQVEILSLLKGDNNIFAVGDEDQCIYSFRGANPSYMVEFNRYFEEGKTLFLSTNYRSRKNIVELSMESIKNNKMRTSKEVISSSEDDGIVKYAHVKGETEEGNYIADTIEKVKAGSSMNYSDFAVLYRTNMESRPIIDSFIKRKIPFVLLDRQFNFFSHFICQDLIAYLKLSIYPLDMESFMRIINKPFRYISKASLDLLKKNYEMGSVFTRLKNQDNLPVFQVKAIDRLEMDINSLNRISILSAVEFILGDLKYYEYIQEYVKKYNLSMEDMDNVISEFKESVKGYKNISEFLTHVEEVENETKKAQSRKDIADAVILSTIHGVKGMEFETVFMINVNEGYLPYKDNDLEEERRLFYVGITRAIKNLFLITPSNIRGEKKEKSLFLTECGLEEFMSERKLFKPGTLVKHNFYGLGTIKELKDNEITISFKDEDRKFDFLVVLKNGLIEVVKQN